MGGWVGGWIGGSPHLFMSYQSELHQFAVVPLDRASALHTVRREVRGRGKGEVGALRSCRKYQGYKSDFL